jgi:DNA polymerase I
MAMTELKVPLVVMNQTYVVDDDSPTTVLFCRDEQMKRHRVNISGFAPHFFASPFDVEFYSEENEHYHRIKDIDRDCGLVDVHRKRVWKIITNIPKDVPKTRHKLRHYQADVLFPLNLRLNAGFKFSFWSNGNLQNDFEDVSSADNYFLSRQRTIPPRTCYFDIEVDTGDGEFKIANFKSGQVPVLAIALFDSYKKDLTVIYWISSQCKNVPKEKVMRHIITFEKKIKARVLRSLGIEITSNEINKFEIDLNLIESNSEQEMYDNLFVYLDEREFDIFTGWNIIDFDIPVLVERARNLRLNYKRFSPMLSVYKVTDKKKPNKFKYVIEGVAQWDMLDLYKRFTIPSEGQKEAFTLDYIAWYELGTGKYGRYGAKTGYLWRNDVDKLVRYVAVDAILPLLIASKRGIDTYNLELVQTTGCYLDDVSSPMREIDAYQLFRARRKGIVLPSKRYDTEESKEDAEGAFVFNPIAGVHRNVISLDLASLYPSIIRSCNAGIETLLSKDDPFVEEHPELVITTPNGTKYRKDIDSFTAEILTEWSVSRKEMQALMRKAKDENDEDLSDYYDAKQKAFKALMNAVYGSMLNAYYRLYSHEMGESVTTTGQGIIKYAAEHVVELKFEYGKHIFTFRVIYGDTDSIFVQILSKEGKPYSKRLPKELMVKLAKFLEEKCNTFFDDFASECNMDEHYFQLKAEKIMNRIFMTTKKKLYCYHVIWNEGFDVDEFKVMGFGTKRSDNSNMSRQLQKETLRLITMGASEEKIIAHIRKYVKYLQSFGSKNSWLDFIDFVGIPMGIGEFDPSQHHPRTRGAIWSNKHLGTSIGSGSKPKYIYMSEDKIPLGYAETDVVAFTNPSQLPEEFRACIDVKAMIKKTVIKKVSDIIAYRGIDPRTLLSNRSMAKL